MDYITDKLSTLSSSYTATEPLLDLCELYKQLLSIPDVASSQYIVSTQNSQPNVAVYTTQRDVNTEARRESVVHYSYNVSTSLYTGVPAVQQDGVVLTLHSPTGNKTLIVRENSKHSDTKNKTVAYWLDIYDRSGRLLSTTTTKDIHGKILNGTLGGIQWHWDEQSIVYTAECKAPKQYGLYDDSVDSDHKLKGLQYEYREEHGEQYGGVVLPRVYVYSLQYLQTIYPVDGIPSNYTVAQPQWMPDNGLIVTGWRHEPRKLGITHYCTRKSELYYIPFNLDAKITETRNKLIARKASKSSSKDSSDASDISSNEKNEMILLTPNEHSAMCARLSPDKSKIIFVTTRNTLAHSASSYIKLIEWNTIAADVSKRTAPATTIKTVVDIVDTPVGDSFCGLYLAAGLLQSNVWFSDSRHIAVATAWRSVNALVIIDTLTGTVNRIVPPGLSAIASVTIADVKQSNVLIHVSTPTQPTSVYSGHLSIAANNTPTCTWTLVQQHATINNTTIQEQINQLQFLVIQHHTSTLPDLPFESILLLPKKRTDKLPGCVVFPHGGPHSSYSTSWMGMSVYFVLCGLAVLHINYRGSTGFGEKFLESLPQRIGALDVIDCIDATNDVIEQKLIDKNNLVAFGGSHGGYLSLHLIGQYPDMFQSCCVRNPVCNVLAMTSCSDIPDWCLYEAGLPYDASTPPTIEQQNQMYAASPVAHIKKVRTPTYLMLGTADRRVPMSQALDYARYLKANQIKHRVAIYPDCQHSLDDKVEITFNMGVDCALWLLQRFYTADDNTTQTMDLSIPKQ